MKLTVGKITFQNDEVKLALNGAKYYFFIWDLDQQLRDWLKYDSHKFKTPEEAIQAIRDMIHEEVDLDT